MKAYYEDDLVTLYAGDCLDVLRSLPDASVDSVCTDPPYALGFMGRKWDSFKGDDVGRGAQARVERATEVTPTGQGHSTSAGPYLASGVDSLRVGGSAFQEWCEAWSRECLRVLKPGGHMLAFGGTRTFHRLASAVEDAGFEIRDSIAWLYGSGFPKSLDVSKGTRVRLTRMGGRDLADDVAATPDAERWQGWGTALKPAFEPVVVGRKPLAGTVAANVLAHGTGALNIDGCRISAGQDYAEKCASVVGLDSNRNGDAYGEWTGAREDSASPLGRWPANVVLDESQSEVLNDQAGLLQKAGNKTPIRRFTEGGYEGGWGTGSFGLHPAMADGDDLTASRFFYVAKADQSERVKVDGIAHPTVKPLTLMRWLVRLVTPPGGTVLEPFAGSGTTVEACLLEGFQCIAIEREADYLPLIMQRINRRRDPVEAVKASGEDGGLFDLIEETPDDVLGEG